MSTSDWSPEAWLVFGDTVLASLEVAGTRRQRSRGLLGRDSVSGAMLLRPARSVHTFGMRFPIDVAYLSKDLEVLSITTMVPNRLGLPRLRSRAVVEAAAGAFDRWSVSVGDRLEIR
jgi:uncharacterized membrane protein (UPF0127 family)